MGRLHGPAHLVSKEADVAHVEAGNAARSPTSPRPPCRSTTPGRSSTRCANASPPWSAPTPAEICYATQNRQRAVAEHAPDWSTWCWWSGRATAQFQPAARDRPRPAGPAHLLEDPADLDPGGSPARNRVGITAGASAPDELVQGLVDAWSALGPVEFSTLSRGHGRRALQIPPPTEVR